MSWPDDVFFPDSVIVQAVQTGGMGTSLGAKYPSPAEVIDQQSLVRGADGKEVVSSSRVTVPLSPPVPLGSLVTVWPNGPASATRTAVVLQVGRDENPPPLPSHQVLYLK